MLANLARSVLKWTRRAPVGPVKRVAVAVQAKEDISRYPVQISKTFNSASSVSKDIALASRNEHTIIKSEKHVSVDASLMHVLVMGNKNSFVFNELKPSLLLRGYSSLTFSLLFAPWYQSVSKFRLGEGSILVRNYSKLLQANKRLRKEKDEMLAQCFKLNARLAEYEKNESFVLI